MKTVARFLKTMINHACGSFPLCGHYARNNSRYSSFPPSIRINMNLTNVTCCFSAQMQKSLIVSHRALSFLFMSLSWWRLIHFQESFWLAVVSFVWAWPQILSFVPEGDLFTRMKKLKMKCFKNLQQALIVVVRLMFPFAYKTQRQRNRVYKWSKILYEESDTRIHCGITGV